VITETKTANKNARALIKKSSAKKQTEKKACNVFDDFAKILAGEEDHYLVGHIQESVDLGVFPDEEKIRCLVQDVFWKENLILHGCIISSNVCPEDFDGFDQAAQRLTRWRRWATVAQIGGNWGDWITKVRSLALQYIDDVVAKGEI
jgi:hypothetical protein